MSFLLRTVSHSAEGREIVRTRAGRGRPARASAAIRDCDVHLTDLAVALRHVDGRARRPAGSRSRSSRGCRSSSTAARRGRSDRARRRRRHPDRQPCPSLHAGRGRDRTRSRSRSSAPARARSSSTRAPSACSRSRRCCPASAASPGCSPCSCSAVVPRLADQGLLRPPAARGRDLRPLPRRRDVVERQPVAAPMPRLKDNCTACHVKPFEAVRDTACKTCHTERPRPCRSVPARPRAAGSRPLAADRARLQGEVRHPARAAASNAIPSMKGRRRCRRRRSVSAADCHADLKTKLPDTKLANAGDFGRSHPQFRPVLIAGWNGERPRLAAPLAGRAAERG